MRFRGERLLLLAVAALVLAADQASKAWVVRTLAFGQSRDLAGWLSPLFSLTYVTNTGVAFGLFQGLGDLMAVVALVTVALVLVYSRHLPPGRWLLHGALGLQLGGALGNLTDRLCRGAVVDFIDLNFWPLQRWPIFNLADASIVVGVGLALLEMGLELRRERAE